MTMVLLHPSRPAATRLPGLAATAALLATLACSLPGTAPTPPPLPAIVLPPTDPAPPAYPTAAPAVPPTDAAPAAEGALVILYQPYAIVVAYSAPQTGTGSALFNPLLQASQKAFEDHGPVHGFGVNLIPFNDNCTEAGGAAVAQQIVADERIVAVLGPVCSVAVRGALPLLEQAGVVMISGSATDPNLSPFGPSVFHRTLLDDDAVHALGYPSQIYIESELGVELWLGAFAAWGGELLETGLNHYAPYQYDAAGILLRALDQAAVLQSDGALVIDRAALRAAVRATAGYPGVTGPITFEADGDRSP